MTIYPEPLLTDEQVKNGGFVLYILGKCEIQTFLSHFAVLTSLT